MVMTVFRPEAQLTLFLRVRTNGYMGASGQTSDLVIRFGDFDFL